MQRGGAGGGSADLAEIVMVGRGASGLDAGIDRLDDHCRVSRELGNSVWHRTGFHHQQSAAYSAAS